MGLFCTKTSLFGFAWALAACVGLAACWSGCAPSSPKDSRPVTLRVSTWGSAEEMAILKTQLAQFETQHPRIQVSVIHAPENYFQKLHILVAGGLTPDVMMVNSFDYPVYAHHKILAPLDKPLDGNHLQSVFFPAALQAFRYQGVLYALPRDVSVLGVFVNTDMLKAHGVEIPQSDWSITDLKALAPKLTQDTTGDGQPDEFGISFSSKPPLMWLPYVWSEGGALLSDDLQHVRLNEPKAVEALQAYADLRNKAHGAPTKTQVGNATMSQLFVQGKLSMLVSGRWSVPLLRKQAKFHWEVLPFPQGRAGSRVGVDASGYALSSTTTHPKEAWELLAFLTSRPVQTAFAQGGLIVPARQDVAQSPAFRVSPASSSQVFLDAMASGVPTQAPLRWNELAEELNLGLEPVFDGTQSARDAIAQMTPKLEAMLK